MSQYQKGKTNLDFTEARDSEWQWHQLGHMQVCTLLQTNNHASTSPLSFLQAGCPSCRPTNSVKALKAIRLSQTKLTILAMVDVRLTTLYVWQGVGWIRLHQLILVQDITSIYISTEQISCFVFYAVERRRRDKINSWIQQLSQLVPDCFTDERRQAEVRLRSVSY